MKRSRFAGARELHPLWGMPLPETRAASAVVALGAVLPVFLLGTDCSPRPEIGKGDIFVILGQSNAVGVGDNLQSYYGVRHAWALPSNSDEWRKAHDPIHVGFLGPRGSTWPRLASRIIFRRDRSPYFVAGARGGSGLVSPPNWSAVPGLYDVALDRFREALPPSILDDPPVRAVLFHQGEQDALNGVSYEDYKAALFDLADRTVQDYDAPLIVAVLSDFFTRATAEEKAAIQLAQRDAAAEHPDICAGPEGTLLGPLADGVHFTTDLQLDGLAELWWQAIVDCTDGFGEPACRDGVDDDGDGLTDTDDPGCATQWDASERSLELPCDDGVDNDGDGVVDFGADLG